MLPPICHNGPHPKRVGTRWRRWVIDPGVFISYARRNGEAFASDLRRRLEREQPKITLWQDRARLEGGVGWWKQITEALDAVEFLVLVMTPAALSSPIARKEWRYARQRGVYVYPVKGAPDSELGYDALPKWMSKAHFFGLTREWDTFVHYLKSPGRVARVTFMAPDLPEGYVERPALLEMQRASWTGAARTRWPSPRPCAARAASARRRWPRRCATTTTLSARSTMASCGPPSARIPTSRKA
jgi:hypothetical protein